MTKIVVLLPLKVPDGKYCWEFAANNSICENFDNEGGYSTCILRLGTLKDTPLGVLKGDLCSGLEEYQI